MVIGKPLYLFIGLVLLFNCNLLGKELVIGENNFDEVNIAGHIVVLVDTHGVWNWDQLPKEEKLWDTSISGNVLSGGLTGYAYWYKIELENFAADQYLRLGDPLIDEIDVYFVNDSGLIRHSRSGASLAFENREVKVLEYYFLLSQGSYACYIRFKKNANFKCPLSIASFKYLMEKGHKNNLVFGLYFGILFVLIFYNLFIYSSIKEKLYLYYIFYLCFLILATSTMQGFSFQYLWPNRPCFNLYLPSIAVMMFVFTALFFTSLLQTKIHLPKLTKGFYVFIGIAILVIIINLFSPIIGAGALQFTGAMFSVFLILVGVRSYLKGAKVAKLFLWAWSFYLLSIIIVICQRNGFIVSNTFTRNAVLYGSALEAILFSLLLAYRIKMLSREKEEAEQREIQAWEDKHLYLREQAHEIRNPVQFTSNYISTLKRNIGYINDLIIQYQGLEEVNFKKKQKQIKQFEDSIELKLVKKELIEGVTSVEMAFDRINDIANNFDLYADKHQFTNVNKCIRDVLFMVRDNCEHIEIREELGQIPMIRSYKGKLDQVFTNIIKNAVEAIKEKTVLKNEFLFIKTHLKREKLIIEIKDTGVGMTEQTKEKLFNKFYTTKAKGKGTGVGLAVCKKIIEDHNGSIQVESERGKGTEFIVELPLN